MLQVPVTGRPCLARGGRRRRSWSLLPAVWPLAATVAMAGASTPPADAVIARVGPDPIVAADVVVHLKPMPPRIGAAPAPDPRRLALEEAIQVRLFVQEARRRGIKVPDGPTAVVEARLVQALVRQEQERAGIPPAAAIPEDEARRFFEEHREKLSRVESVRLSAIVLDASQAGDPVERLLRTAAGASDEAFEDLVKRYSTDEASRARAGFLAEVDHRGRGVDDALAAVALAMRRPGDVGLVAGSDGRLVLPRATQVRLEPARWDEATAARVRNLIVLERRDRLRRRLAEHLRARTPLTTDLRALDRIRVP